MTEEAREDDEWVFTAKDLPQGRSSDPCAELKEQLRVVLKERDEAVKDLETQEQVTLTIVRETDKNTARKSALSTLQFARVNHACVVVYEALGDPPYLVGSATRNEGFRDVDIRSILADDEWDAMFKGKAFFWSLFCLGVSAYLSDVTGLPIDYQAQRMTEANAKFGGLHRNPMGMGARLFAGGGDADSPAAL